MNILKRISGIIISAIVLFTIVFLPDNRVSAAGLSVSVSASKVNVGQTVTATVSIPSGYGATVAVSFDSSVLTYSSCSVTASANGGTVVLNIGDAMGYSNSATITFKASSAGTSNISASATTAGDAEGESVDLSGASKSVTVQNKADSASDKKEDSNNNNNNDNNNNNENNNSDDNKEDSSSTKSADNSLKSLVLSAGALSPKFSPSTTSYTATVDYSVTSIAITAVPSNSKASVVSVSGNEGLKVGANTVTIIVKAENGVTSTYTITVTREEEKADEPEVAPVSFAVNGNTLYCINDIPDEVVPEDFEKSQITIDNNNCASLNFLNGDIKLLYLGAEDGTNASLYVYDAKEGAVYSFVKLSSENSYIILLLPDVSGLPEGYEESALSIEGKGVVTAYKSPDNEFYLVYAMNNSGNTRWYQFDEEEYTYQRYVGHIENVVPSTEEAVETISNTTNDNQTEKLQQKLNRTYIFSGIIILILLLICLAMYLLMKSNNRPGTGAIEELDESNHVNVADSEYVDELSDADMDDADSEYVDESGDDYTDDTDNDYVDESSDADTDNIDNEYSAEANEVDNEDNSIEDNRNEENNNESEDDVYLEKIDISEFYSSDEQVKKDDSTNSKNVEEAEVRAMLADAEKLLKEAMASTHVEADVEESDVEFLDID